MGNITEIVQKATAVHGKSGSAMLDVIKHVQAGLGSISDEAVSAIAREMNCSKVDIEGVVTFYHFFSKKPVGKYSVYLNNSAVAVMKGAKQIAKAFEKAAGTTFGSVTADGQIGLFYTSCIGMNDQEPAVPLS